MEPFRPTYWNIPNWAQILVYILGALAIIIFTYGVYGHIKKWRLGKPEVVTGSIFERLKTFVKYALLQLRLSSDTFAIVMHLMIFWGMAILFIGTILATVDWDVTHLILGFQFLKEDFYLLFELTLDIFGALLILGLGMALYRRYILRPERLKTPEPPTFQWDSLYLLIILLLVNVTGFIIEGLRIAAQNPPWASWSPVGFYLSTFFSSLPFNTLTSLHFFFWSFHLLLAVLFIASIPYTKAFHIVSSPISIFLRKLSPPGGLISGGESGVEKIRDFTWRQLLQVDACTWCGRCQDTCPAYASGFSLSPKNLVLKLDAQLLHSAGTNRSNSGEKEESKSLHASVVSASELWACTTCLACEETCPVFIEHPRMIVEMRRHLVNQGEIEKLLQDALINLNRYGNSFGQSDRMRAKWTQGLDFKIKDARKEPVEYLWFVGDYASYDPRIQNITRTTAKVFQKAGLDFGILFEGERNSGNDVRRIGEEGLFE
ncbi:MAG: (Fe-S)-binding protein, partial [Proteobacteria bacterium]|nr:(Fe-S)-binding protein [Pseudomonadota bacterium]